MKNIIENAIKKTEAWYHISKHIGDADECLEEIVNAVYPYCKTYDVTTEVMILYVDNYGWTYINSNDVDVGGECYFNSEQAAIENAEENRYVVVNQFTKKDET